MNDISWLKRIYPDRHQKFMEVFGEDYIPYLRCGYKIGILTEKVGHRNPGDLCLFKRSKEYIEDVDSDGNILNIVWTGAFEIHHVTTHGKYTNHDCSYSFKCKEFLP